jgi:hypothetical protein
MLWRKLLLTGVSAPVLANYWVIPGGRILTRADDGSLRLMEPADGWPAPTDGGDPFVDGQGRVGFNRWHNFGGGIGEIVNARVLRDPAEELEPRALGGFRGWAAERTAVWMNSTGYGLGGSGHIFPSWTLEGGGTSYETGYTAGWPWEQQDNLDANGNPTIAEWLRVIQASYIAGMAYSSDVCATRDLSVVLRQVADTYSNEPSVDPATGRRWLGWTLDAAGTARRIRDLTPQEARQLGHDNGFVPNDDEIVLAGGQSYSWLFLRPIGPFGTDGVAATGVLQYTETYQRLAAADERPWFTSGRVGYERNHACIPLTDGDMTWLTGRGVANQPILVDETRTTYLFVTMVIRAGGMQGITVTGRSVSRSTRVTNQRNTNPSISCVVFRRISGGYDVMWSGHPSYDVTRYAGTTFDTEFYTSPNGWRVAVNRPARFRRDNTETVDEYLTGYMPVLQYPNSPNGDARAPAKPDDWNDDEQGPWIVPPNDIPYVMFWRGFTYIDLATGEVNHQQGPNSNTADYAQYGYAVSPNPYNPNGPYPKDRAERWYGSGSFVVAQHSLSNGRAYAVHQAGRIVPGVSGPGGSLQPHAEPDGTDPTMRLLQFPRRSIYLARTQSGRWLQSLDGGRTWRPSMDLGLVEGTMSASCELDPPELSDADAGAGS